MKDDNINYPKSLESEMAILGNLISRPESMYVLNGLGEFLADYFFSNIHKYIYKAICHLEDEGHGIDVISVVNVLMESKQTNKSISIEYLVDLIERSPMTHSIEYHAQIVRNYYFLRKMIDTSRNIIVKAQNFEGELPEFIEDIEKSILEISASKDNKNAVRTADMVIVDTLDAIEKRIQQDSIITGVDSGYDKINQLIGGWQPSDLIILAARPGMGKTAFALNLASHAINADKKVLIFSLEMADYQLMERLVSAEAKVDSSSLRKGDLTEEQVNRVVYASKKFSKMKSFLGIDQTPSITLTELRSKARRYYKEHGLDMIIIDYLQLMGSASKHESREREVAEMSKGLKGLAKELNIPIITLSQLNRGPDTRADKRPLKSDLRESGSIEQDADMIVLIYRDEYYNENSEKQGVAEIIFAKNRHGENDSIELAFMPNYVSFYNLNNTN